MKTTNEIREAFNDAWESLKYEDENEEFCADEMDMFRAGWKAALTKPTGTEVCHANIVTMTREEWQHKFIEALDEAISSGIAEMHETQQSDQGNSESLIHQIISLRAIVAQHVSTVGLTTSMLKEEK